MKSDDSTFGYVSVNALMEFARNHVDRKVDCNDIARFPRSNVRNADEQQSLQQIFGIPFARLRELAEAEHNQEAILPKLDCKTCHWRKDLWKCKGCYGTLTPENYANWYELDDEIKWQREQDALAAADAGKGENG